MLFGLTAICLGLVGGLPAAAQFTDSGVPEGAIDGASISYLEESGEDPLAPYYSFEVFTFEDDDAATAALADLPQQLSEQISAGTDASDPTTGDAELVEVDAADVEGLDGLGDEARAYELSFGEDLGNSAFSLLTVRDGANVHLWLSFVLDFSAVLGDSGTPAATPAATPTVDAGQGVADLVKIGDAWFNGDKPDDGDLIDQLPTIDQLPDGYTEADRYENLDEFKSGAGALLGLDLAA